MKRPFASYVAMTVLTVPMILGTAHSFALAQGSGTVAFDVVSIKPSAGGGGLMRAMPGNVTACVVVPVPIHSDVEARFDPAAPAGGLLTNELAHGNVGHSDVRMAFRALGERPQCGGRGGFGQMIAGGMPMSQFVTQLSQLTSRVVVDRTGLTGGYDLDLKWTPTADQLPPGPPPPGFEPSPIDPNGPSLFTALEEQLGLKLDSTRGPIEVLVIDSIERPTEN